MKMALDRRQFVIRSSLALAGGVLLHQAPGLAAEPASGFEELRGSVGIYTKRGGTIGWLVRSDALVVVDSQFPESAGDCLAGLRKRSARKFDALINTHHHGDHTAGNGVFRPEAKIIVAHENVPKLQKKSAEERGNADKQTYADTTFSKSWKMDAGGETVTATYYGPAHTGGDCVVHFHESNVVHMGDLIFNRWYPFIDRPAGASIAGWIDVLEKVVAAHDKETLYIFGHGRPEFGVSGRAADVKVMRDFLAALLEFTAKGIKQGKSVDELAQQEGLPGFGDHVARGDFLSLGANIEVAYEELTAG
jgi:glyoxylase-like metal-dependent hydrolase (beta-lactamase superfamily II)